MKNQPKKPTKKEIIKEGFRDWLEETALHGLKYMTTRRSGILGFLIWVCHNCQQIPVLCKVLYITLLYRALFL